MKKILTIFLVLAIVYSVPWLLYGFALANLTGKPTKPGIERLDEAKAQETWKSLKEEGPIQFKPLTPWYYTLQLLGLQKEKETSGERTAYYVAREHAAVSLKNRKMIYWHLSACALTIWLTRNWSSYEILAKAFEIEKSKTASDQKKSPDQKAVR